MGRLGERAPLGKLSAALLLTAYASSAIMAGRPAVAAKAVAATANAVAAPARAVVSERAPRFLLETPSGRDLTLAAYAGRPLVLNVFASWCPPCRAELPRIVAAARSHTGVTFVGVDEQEAVTMATRFASEMSLPYVIAIDHGQFAASYGATSLPETVFIDAGGTVRAIFHGAITAAALAKDLALIAPKVGGTTE